MADQTANAAPILVPAAGAHNELAARAPPSHDDVLDAIRILDSFINISGTDLLRLHEILLHPGQPH